MKFLEVAGAVLAHTDEGPPGAPAVVMLHSLGASSAMWAPQRAALSRTHRVVAIDLPGHGLSEPRPGEYGMASLAADALAVMDRLGIASAHVAGLSIGGRIAMEMATAAPARVLSLMLCDTALDFPPRERWEGRIAAIRANGMAGIVDGVIANWAVDQSLPSTRGLARMVLATDVAGYAGCAAALRDCGVPGAIVCPTTVVCGAQDPSTTPEKARAIVAHIPGARYVEIEGAAHIPCFEQEAAMTDALLGHLAGLAARGAEAGMAVRRAVLGCAHVDRSEAALTELDRPFRELILEGVWGRVWTRPGLSRHQRSLITLSMLAALGLDEEFRLHIRATANTGVSREEIAEAMLHVASYAGVPRANHALKIVKEVLA